VQVPTRESLNRPVQFFTGKGGAGKSTVIAAVATRAARGGERPLIVELGVHTSSSRLFGGPTVGYEPVEVAESVHATRVLFEPALVDYVTSRLKLRPIAKLVAKNNSLRRFFMAAPGVDEIVTLHRVAELDANDAWGPILVDLESTGHALMFFDLPEVMDVFLEDGPLRQVLDTVTRLLHDTQRCAVHIVAVPEPLAVRETIDLYRNLRDRKGIHLGHLFINRIPPAWLDEAEQQSIRDYLDTASADDPCRPSLLLAEHLSVRRDIAEKCIHGLKHDIDLPTVLLDAQDDSSTRIVQSISERLEPVEGP
jgi:anion-transporting  ArsA/GET3 family ATPase